jgi:predicted porin
MMKSRMRTPRLAVLAAMLAASGFATVAFADDAKPEKSATDKALEALVKGFYGTIDVSIDDSSKGMGGMEAFHTLGSNPYVLDPNNPKGAAFPFGRVGFQPAFSTNASGLGWRGSHDIPGTDTKFILQIEANVALTSAPGLSTSYTAQTNGTSGAIGLGTAYVGFSGKDWGAVKLGHGTTPYKKATDRLDPFAGMIGDMPVIMGNTGGDNRVEFNAVMDHALWYESPSYSGFSYDLMFSPGQNRNADSNLNLSGQSSNCSGGNIPGSGNLPGNCDDGGFDDAWSAAFKYETKELYLTAAFELHRNVNRNSDGIGMGAVPYGFVVGSGSALGNASANPLLYSYLDPYYSFGGGLMGADPGIYAGFWGNGGSNPFVNDIGNEAAYKFGAQYIFSTGTTVDAIFERMTRSLPAVLEFQNERQRNGWWLAVTQELTSDDNVNLGWAHAGKTPGDPGGQHNFNPSNTDDTADMFTLAYKHKLDKQLYWYADAAETVNHGNAHYDLGGGGHGVKTDCHDGTTTPVIDYSSAGNTTWGGCKPKGISVGLNYKF